LRVRGSGGRRREEWLVRDRLLLAAVPLFNLLGVGALASVAMGAEAEAGLR
jgi:hypothetical protein